MVRFDDCAASFSHALSRARDMVSLFDALTLISVRASNEDALRSAYFQAVSSFDFFVHEIVAVEARHRFEHGLPTRNILVPMDVTIISSQSARVAAADTDYRQRNSYRAFVDPGKLAEVLACFTNDPWLNIETTYQAKIGGLLKKEDMKSQLKSIWQRRNKIAHEADINPTLSGIGLWPIDKNDTTITIDFVEQIATCLPDVVATTL